MDLVNMLWRNRTLVPNADDPTLLFDAKQYQQGALTQGRRGDNITTADSTALRKLRTSFRAAVLSSLHGSGIDEKDLHETLSMTQNWCCASFAREFLEQKRQLITGETTDEIVLKPSQIKVQQQLFFRLFIVFTKRPRATACCSLSWMMYCSTSVGVLAYRNGGEELLLTS